MASSPWATEGGSILDQSTQALTTAVRNHASKKTVFGFLAHNVLESILAIVGDPVDPTLFRNKAAESFRRIMTSGFNDYRAGTIPVYKFIAGTIAALETAAHPTTFEALRPQIDELFDAESEWTNPAVSYQLARARRIQVRIPTDELPAENQDAIR